jgi:hypothetical protein
VSHDDHEPQPTYDRQLLLFGDKRDVVLDLWEVQQYGADSYGDVDHVSVYGRQPPDWYARGVRLLGRTAVECTGDALADAIAVEVAALADSAPSTADALVIDPFLGSGNTLYWIARRTPGSRGIGFELDPRVFQLTSRNLALLEASIEVMNVDYATGLAGLAPASGGLVVVFIAPPWGDALDPKAGLDLRVTLPPVPDIVDLLVDRFPLSLLLVAIQVFEKIDPVSLSEVAARFDWSSLRVYDVIGAGHNHGVLLGTRGWTPP